MAQNLNAVKGTPRAFGKNIIVSDMHFGEQTTAGGIILGDDDGKTRGIYPRWGRVYSKGIDNKDKFQVGEWILIAHGRWTRGMKVDTPEGEIVVRKIELERILATITEKPDGMNIGTEYSDGEHATIDPSSFINQ